MNLSAYIKKTIKCASLVVAAFGISACDPILDNDYGDCTVRYHVRFKYDYNMLGVDAFSTQVESVTLYAFDADGVLCHQLSETCENILTAGGCMEVPFAPAEYHLVTWCHNIGCQTTELPAMECGTSTIDELKCRIGGRTQKTDCTEVCEIGPIFHGEAVNPQAIAGGDELNPTYLVPLMKNTNNVRIILQNLSSEPLNAGDFDFTIVEENGLMNYDNRLLADEPLTYVPFYTGGGSVEYEQAAYRPSPYTEHPIGLQNHHITRQGNEENLNVAIAEFTFGRLMADRNPRLTVTNRLTGDKVLSIPLVDYLKLARSEYVRGMSDQEYLDREDSFAITFFLDEDENWFNAYILINSWRVVLMDVEL